MRSDPRPTDTKTRVIGHSLSRVITRFPYLWTVLASPVRRYFDDRAVGWDERTGAGSSSHLAPLAAATGRLDMAPERILDLGCGTGEGTLFLAREYPTARVRGVDISEAMIERARAKIGLDPEARIAFRVADASDLPYRDRSFDIVLQVNLPLFPSEIPRVLRPTGRFVMVSSHGPDTPFFTPVSTAAKALGTQGMILLEEGRSGNGSFAIFGRDEDATSQGARNRDG